MTKGISTRTTSLGFQVLRLHYSSDPNKDPATEAGRLWMEQAKAGMSDARWRKEYEIDYGALGGQLVFPEFDPGIHVVEESRLDPSQWTVWMACDPHPRTPHAFHKINLAKGTNFAKSLNLFQGTPDSSWRGL